MRFAWLVAGATLTFIVVSGCSSQGSAPSSEKTSSKAQAIQNGTTDTTDTYAVGLCGGQAGQCEAVCSGALILPNLVVTARHCVDYLASETVDCSQNPSFQGRHYGGSDGDAPLYVTTSTNMFSGSPVWHSVKKVILPTDAHVCGNDIALLILNQQIPGSEATPIIPGVQYPMNDPKYVSTFTAIGYGATSPPPSPGQMAPGAGTRRIKENIDILCIPGDSLIDCPADAQINPNEFVGGDGTCSGDSGSSPYEQQSYNKGKPLSFGVLSRGGEQNGKCVGSIYTRLDKWRDLVISAATEASANWQAYPKPNPDWTVYVPPATKDGGADSSTTSTTPGGKGFGEPCAEASDCTSGQCIDPGDGNFFCSKACTDSASCADGYECSAADQVCVPLKQKPQSSTTTTSGCSASPASSRQTPWLGLGLGLAAVAFVRRRRS